MKGFEHLATSGTHQPRSMVKVVNAAIGERLRQFGVGLLDAAGVPTNIPMETPSQAKGHWRKKAKTAAAQRARMRREVARWLEAHGPVMRITVTRVAPRRLDEPNLGAALKHAIDGLSDALRIDDGSRAVEWVLKQRKGQATVEWEVKAL